MLWVIERRVFDKKNQPKIIGFCVMMVLKHINYKIADFNVKLINLNTLAYLHTQKRM